MPFHLKRVFKRRSAFYPGIGVPVLVLFFILGSGSSNRDNELAVEQGNFFQWLKILSVPGVPGVPGPVYPLLKIENYIKSGDTIIDVLEREGVEHQAACRFCMDIRPVYDLKKIGAGKKYTLFLSKRTGELERFRYEVDLNRYLEAWKGKETGAYGVYKGRIVTIPFEVKREFISGGIRESLFVSILEVGEKPELADIMASLYDYDIDFNRDIRKNDTFALVVEKMYLRGQFARYGDVLAAEFGNRGKIIQVIRYTDPEGKTAYYHPDGRSVRKMFLRCPLPFMRVTSRYGNRRHPLLGFSAQHNGIDLGAPIGTRIRATAPGIVMGTGYSGSKGKFITLRHKNNYVAHYYHLSGFAGGIRRGKGVEQGQVIGFVGRTGWSTGPHLHYGLKKDGRFINPLVLKSPSKEPVKKEYLEDFKPYAARVFLLLSGSKLVKIPALLSSAILDMPVQRTLQSMRLVIFPISR